MFLHNSRLPHVLRPDDYSLPEQYARERSEIFSRCWHPVATMSDLSSEGDFVTATVAGTPVIVWRSQGVIQSFLNSCSHRFSKITCDPRGCVQTLKCQYHGWEYNSEGRTQKIPEAHGFKPWEREGHRLRRFRTVTFGQLVFVCLADEDVVAEPICDSPISSWEHLLSADRRLCSFLELEIDANWKVVVENAIESYHLESVHRSTFRRNPSVETCSHELEEWGSTFRTNSPPVSPFQRLIDFVIYRAIGIEQETSYFHCLFFPNIMIGRAGMFSWLQVVEPSGSLRCRSKLWMFVDPGKRNPVSWSLSRMMAYGAGRFTRTAMLEDKVAVEAVQQGLLAADSDTAGCLSPREERVWHFQKFVAARTHQQSVSDQTTSAA